MMMRMDLASSIAAGPSPLHAPDGFFSIPIVIVGWVIAGAAIAVSVQHTNRQLNERMVPLMGVLAAFIFAAQMLNFPVAGGTSGHFVGGALAAILLGPWAAILVMTAVVATQALIFQDGGLVALGVNLTNMAVISSLVSWWLFRLSAPVGGSGTALLLRGAAAAWVSVVAAAVAVAVQLGISGTAPLGLALPAMAVVHMVIGLGEGIITAGALAFLSAARRDLLDVAASAK